MNNKMPLNVHAESVDQVLLQKRWVTNIVVDYGIAVYNDLVKHRPRGHCNQIIFFRNLKFRFKFKELKSKWNWLKLLDCQRGLCKLVPGKAIQMNFRRWLMKYLSVFSHLHDADSALYSLLRLPH